MFSNAYMYVYHMHAQGLQESEEAVGSPRTRITGRCEPPHECWESDLSPLQEPQVLLTADPNLWSLGGFLVHG